MKMSEEFPSKYLRAADLEGREVKVIMSHCEREEVGQKDGRPDFKPVLYFQGKEKGVVLNKTNAHLISDFYGDDTEDWAGQPLVLFSVKTDFQGKVVDGLRCRIPTAKDSKSAAPRREDPISSGLPGQRRVGGVKDNFPGDRDLNDDIPDFGR